MRIFLSYGHDEYVSLASRVKRDLKALGHEVWFDVERLKPGGDWERYIEEGFERVSKDSESGRFFGGRPGGKLRVFKRYFNRHRAHSGLEGGLPEPGEAQATLSFASYRWQQHCRGLYQTPLAA